MTLNGQMFGPFEQVSTEGRNPFSSYNLTNAPAIVCFASLCLHGLLGRG
jgi:hypothetical protein